MKRKSLFTMVSAIVVPLTVAALSGVAQADVAGVTVTFAAPASITAGAAPTTFTGSATNNTATDYAAVRYDLVFTGDAGLTHNQITLQYQTGPTTWATIPLAGSTASGGSITGFFGPSTGFPFPHSATALTTTFRVSAAASAPLGTLHAAVTLDQVNGSGTPTGTLASASGDTTIVSQFSDVSTTNPFGPAIDQLAAQGVILGYGGGTFHPVADVTRQAFAAYMARVLALPNTTGGCTGTENKFGDLSDENPFCKAINALAAAKIVGGYSDGTFHAGATITRQAIAAFIERADSWLEHGKDATKVTDAPCVVPIPFTDVSEQNHFCGDIEFLAHNGIATGYSNGTFGVTRATTRQATAAFLLRFEQFELA